MFKKKNKVNQELQELSDKYTSLLAKYKAKEAKLISVEEENMEITTTLKEISRRVYGRSVYIPGVHHGAYMHNASQHPNQHEVLKLLSDVPLDVVEYIEEAQEIIYDDIDKNIKIEALSIKNANMQSQIHALIMDKLTLMTKIKEARV